MWWTCCVSNLLPLGGLWQLLNIQLRVDIRWNAGTCSQRVGLLWEHEVHVKMLLCFGGPERSCEIHAGQHLRVNKHLHSLPLVHKTRNWFSFQCRKFWGVMMKKCRRNPVFSLICSWAITSVACSKASLKCVLGIVSSVPYWYLDYGKRADLKFDISVLYLVKVICVQIYKKMFLIPSVVFLCLFFFNMKKWSCSLVLFLFIGLQKGELYKIICEHGCS